jgi:hypothetical protein
MNLNRVIALYIVVAALVLAVAGVLLAVVVSDSMHEPVSVPDEFEAPVAPVVP